MAEADERQAIARTVKVLTDIAGTRPVGWHTRSTPSPNTRRLLVEEGGFLYDSDDYSDDLPFFVEVWASATSCCPTASTPTTCTITRASIAS